jgi:hypothetical protein
MRRSHAQTPSLAYPEPPDPEYGPSFQRTIAPNRTRLPGLARAGTLFQAQGGQSRVAWNVYKR